MSLLEMSVSGGLLILAAVLIRALGRDRLPGQTFTALWTLAALRLTVPVRLPFRLSAWTLLQHAVPHAAVSAPTIPAPIAHGGQTAAGAVDIIQNIPTPDKGAPIPTMTVLWLAGTAICALAFAAAYIRSRRTFRSSLPVDSAYLRDWLAVHTLRRRVQVRRSDRIAAPLTYGTVRPVILLPKSVDPEDGATLGFVLEHELAHIRRFDAARKLVLAGVVCLHWFNPLVWALFVLAGRDMELCCDAAVLRALGPDSRKDYARALLSMEEIRGGFGGLVSGFSKNAIEERIHAIMKNKNKSFLSAVLALALVLGTGAVFATAAPEDEADETAPTVFSGDVMQSQDGKTLYVFTAEGKPVSMTQEEYRVLFTDPVEVEWWTAEEYAQWLEQEKKDLQDCLGQHAWTNSDGWFTWTQEKIDETIEMYEQVLEEIKNGLLVSKTVDGRTDVGLIEGGGQTPYSSEDGMVMYAFDGDAAYTGWTSPDLYRGYSYVFNGGDSQTTLGPYDTPEELRAALEDEVDARVADGRLSEEEARGILESFLPIPGGAQVFTVGGNAAYSFHSGDSVELTEDQQEMLDTLLEDQAVADTMDVTVDQGLYSVETVLTDELQEQLETLDAALEPYRPFGVQYSYSVPDGEFTMRWNGREVRGIVDETAGTWTTAHAGLDAYGEDAVELFAVYTDGVLTGLRLGTEAEQEEYTALRREADNELRAHLAEQELEAQQEALRQRLAQEEEARAKAEQAQPDALRTEAGLSLSGSPDESLLPSEPAEDETENSVRYSHPDEPPEEAAQPIQEADGTVTVPPNEAFVEFFSRADGSPHGLLERGWDMKVADVTAAKGNAVSVGLETRLDAPLTVSLRGGDGDMRQDVQLKAGETQTVTFYPDQAGTYQLYLENPGEYEVQFIVSWAVN